MTSNFPSRYQGVPIHHWVIKGPHFPLWPLIPIMLSRVPFIIASSRGPPFPPSRHQRDPNFQNIPWDVYWLKSAIFKGAGIFFGRGWVRNILGGHKFLERKIYLGPRGSYKIFDDQNVGSHKMTTGSVIILFKKTDFNTILACLWGKVYRWGGVIKYLLPKWGEGS